LEKVRVGVVGIGHLGRYHALNYAQIPLVDLVGVIDLDREKAGSIASESGCEPYENLEFLLERVEAVSIAVPTDQHFEVGRRILDRGIHCLIEKPIARNLEEADGLIRISKDKGLVLQVGHVERFNPAMRALEGVETQPRFIESHRLAPFDPRGTEVAVVLDLMIHDIDIILNLVKKPIDRVDASGVAVVSDSIDIANARIRFENGCVANLTASRISQRKMRKMRLFQKETYIAVDFLRKITEIYRLEREETEPETIVGEIGVGERKKQVVYHRPEVPEGEGLRKELEAFVQTIRGGCPSAVSGEEGRAALSVAMQILEKMGV
jgi:predicted dehydrogenase